MIKKQIQMILLKLNNKINKKYNNKNNQKKKKNLNNNNMKKQKKNKIMFKDVDFVEDVLCY